jgi:hypothetical protein
LPAEKAVEEAAQFLLRYVPPTKGAAGLLQQYMAPAEVDLMWDPVGGWHDRHFGGKGDGGIPAALHFQFIVPSGSAPFSAFVHQVSSTFGQPSSPLQAFYLRFTSLSMNWSSSQEIKTWARADFNKALFELADLARGAGCFIWVHMSGITGFSLYPMEWDTSSILTAYEPIFERLPSHTTILIELELPPHLVLVAVAKNRRPTENPVLDRLDPLSARRLLVRFVSLNSD